MTYYLLPFGNGSKDPLHVDEIMEWNGKIKGSTSILMVGDSVLTPHMIGVCSRKTRDGHIKILNQFKKSRGLENTVLMNCEKEGHTIQPCYCECMEYRKQAFILCSCDVCLKVPIGSVYACPHCDEVVHFLCQECFSKYDHGCDVGWFSSMEKVDSVEEVWEKVEGWKRIPKVNEPRNRLKQSVLNRIFLFLNEFYDL